MKREPQTKSETPAPPGSLRAYVLIQTLPGRLEGVARALRRLPTVLTVDSVAGPYDIVALVEVSEIPTAARWSKMLASAAEHGVRRIWPSRVPLLTRTYLSDERLSPARVESDPGLKYRSRSSFA